MIMMMIIIIITDDECVRATREKASAGRKEGRKRKGFGRLPCIISNMWMDDRFIH